MKTHPEMPESINEIIGFVNREEMIDVWCTNCKAFRKANAKYAKYLNGEISSCRHCRD